MEHRIKTFERSSEMYEAAVTVYTTPENYLPMNLRRRLWLGRVLTGSQAAIEPRIIKARTMSDIVLVSLHAYPNFKNEDEPEQLHEGELVRIVQAGNPTESYVDTAALLQSMIAQDDLTYTFDQTRKAARLSPSELIIIELHPDLLV